MDIAQGDDSIVLVFGDVSVYLFQDFKQLYPSRFYNMGICENTLISVSAGLAANGLTPFVHTIGPFVTERSYEQIKLDLAYNLYPANIVTCGASFDYSWDGATHHCYSDLAILRLLPNIEVLQPGSRRELDGLIRSNYNSSLPTYYRLSDHPHDIDTGAGFGKGVVLKDTGSQVTVVTAGPILQNVLPAVQDLPVNLLYFNTIKPMDLSLLAQYRHTDMVVIQDALGLYDAVLELPEVRATQYGLGNDFCCCYGTLHDIRQVLGLAPQQITDYLRAKLAGK